MSGAVLRLWWALRRTAGRISVRARWAALVAVVAVAAMAWQHAGSQPAPAPGAPAVHQPAAALMPDQAEQSDPGMFEQLPAPTAVADPSPDAAREVATRFAGNFADPGRDLGGWLARITPDISAQLREQYQMADLRNIPQATVSSVVGPVSQLPGSMTFQIGYSDSTAILVRVETGLEGWKVDNVLPVGSEAAAAAQVAAADPVGPVQ